jgi:hemerythrin-like metal-binding protein
LHGAVKAGASYDRVVESLGDIYAHIAAHFALEEKMMRRSRYPAYSEHKQDHEALLDDLRDIMDEIEDGGTFDQARLSNDLRRWFSEHFQTHDARLHRPAVTTVDSRLRRSPPRRTARVQNRCAILSNQVLILNFLPKPRRPLSGPLWFWLGDQDSNLGWRSQSPQSYR